jgi:N-acetylglucosaminyldiphosphoundecaprenol N-acetyl-beta-D-mannosaminyltransferase
LLIQVAAQRKHRLFLLGATPQSAGDAVAKLQAQYPGLIIAGHYSPPFNQLLEMDHDQIKRRILEARPDLLFVSFGCPKQEKWIAMHYRTLGVPVIVGVGATIDFLAGHLKRAPKWMRRTGTEWMFRLAQEPRRLFRRYFKDLRVFGSAILAQWWRLQFRQPRCSADSSSSALSAVSDWHGNERPVEASEIEPGTWQLLKAPKRVDLASARGHSWLMGRTMSGDGCHCLLDLSQVKFIDSTGVGLLMRLQKKLDAFDHQLVLLDASPAVRRALFLMHLMDFFAFAPDLTAALKLIEARASEETAAVTSEASEIAGLIVWHGEITAATAERVWRRTVPNLACGTARLNAGTLISDTLIDLSDVRFIDSTGLDVMIRAKKLAQRTGRRVVFTGLQPPVRNVVHLAHLEDFLLSKTT